MYFSQFQNCEVGEDGWQYIGGYCIYYSTDTATYDEAVQICQAKSPNSRLFEPRNQVINDLVGDAHRPDHWFWFGVNDKATEGKYIL